MSYMIKLNYSLASQNKGAPINTEIGPILQNIRCYLFSIIRDCIY